jgi:hypothetical protein
VGLASESNHAWKYHDLEGHYLFFTPARSEAIQLATLTFLTTHASLAANSISGSKASLFFHKIDLLQLPDRTNFSLAHDELKMCMYRVFVCTLYFDIAVPLHVSNKRDNTILFCSMTNLGSFLFNGG